jgi:septum formation protein
MSPLTLLLASASPRRRALLAQLGVVCQTEPAAIDESRRSGEDPGDYVRRMATEKTVAVAARHAGEPLAVLGADTTVVIDGDVLGKPVDQMDGLAMLARLSGRRHSVMTAVTVSSTVGVDTVLVETEVEFISLGLAQCQAYLDTDEPWDKAGAYAIQGLGGAFVSRINGSYSNVVGLPLCETWQLLAAHGIETLLPGPAWSADE